MPRGTGCADTAHTLGEQEHDGEASESMIEIGTLAVLWGLLGGAERCTRRAGLWALTWADLDDLGLSGYLRELHNTMPSREKRADGAGERRIR